MGTAIIRAPISNNNILPISSGGTNANTAAAARTNLDVYSKSEVTSAIQQSMATLIHDSYSGRSLNYKAVAFTTSRAMIFLPPELGKPTSVEITNVVFPSKGNAGNISNISIANNDVSFDFSMTGVVIGQPAVVWATVVW